MRPKERFTLIADQQGGVTDVLHFDSLPDLQRELARIASTPRLRVREILDRGKAVSALRVKIWLSEVKSVSLAF